MAIRPEECGPLSQAELKEIDNLEFKIDKALKRFYRPGYGEHDCLHAIGISNLSVKGRKEIISRYEQAGWRVRNVGGPGIGEVTWKFVEIQAVPPDSE